MRHRHYVLIHGYVKHSSNEILQRQSRADWRERSGNQQQRHRDVDFNTNSYACFDANAISNPYAYTNACTHIGSNPNSYTDADTHADTQTHVGSNPNSYTFFWANSKRQ